VIQTREPITLAAGDTISFTKSLTDYPASSGWILTYSLLGGPDPILFTGTASGTDFAVTVAAAVTELWLAGNYELVGFVELNGVRHQVYSGSLVVSENPATTEAEPTTHAQRMLVNLEAQLEKMAQDDIIDSSIEGTQVRREARVEIFKLRAKYRHERESEVAAENARNGRPTGRKILTRLAVTFPTNSPSFGAGPMFQGGNV
jgi:hypothetical protein